MLLLSVLPCNQGVDSYAISSFVSFNVCVFCGDDDTLNLLVRELAMYLYSYLYVKQL